ncbi:MAG: 4-(cytidine 5'-diphospho)-2-C-methyl-D-erythritol kinase [Gammaproteobacteria bacterium]
MLRSGPWPAPAKLNLFLHVTGRRSDGYHELQTLFQFLDYGDQLWFESEGDGQIRRIAGNEQITESQDIIIKSAKLLKKLTGCYFGASIGIDKKLPVGGGLGGGSSDAATTLLVLNRLWNTGLSIPQLADLALKIGADVPVFIRGHAAWAEGIGEELKPVTVLDECWYLVIYPGVSVSSAEIFSDLQLTRNGQRITIADFVSGNSSNQLEPVVLKRYPQVAKAISWLNGFSSARMTGSGACVFAAFPDRLGADAALLQMPAQWRGFIAQACNRSPLHQKLDRFRVNQDAPDC